MRTFAFVCLFFLLTSCANLEGSIAEKLAPLVQKGTITVEQFDAIMAIVREAKASGSDWLARIAEIGGSVVLSLLGVRAWRGSTVARKGSLASPS